MVWGKDPKREGLSYQGDTSFCQQWSPLGLPGREACLEPCFQTILATQWGQIGRAELSLIPSLKKTSLPILLSLRVTCHHLGTLLISPLVAFLCLPQPPCLTPNLGVLAPAFPAHPDQEEAARPSGPRERRLPLPRLHHVRL